MTERKTEQLGDTSQQILVRDLIILAMGPTRTQCPFDAEVWAVNNGYKQIKEMNVHPDKLFLAHCQTQDAEGNDVFNWDELNNLNIDIINTHRVKGLKSRLFPMKRIILKFESDYFSDTICYMLAYAIDQATKKEGLKWILKYPFRIRLYGCDMLTKDEYDTEKGGMEYWIGFARGLGIKVEIANGSALCKTKTGKPYGAKLKPSDFSIEAQIKNFLADSTGVLTGEVPDDIIDKIINNLTT